MLAEHCRHSDLVQMICETDGSFKKFHSMSTAKTVIKRGDFVAR